MIQISQCIFLLICLRRVFSEYQRGFGGCEFSASHLHYHNVRLVMASASNNLLPLGESAQAAATDPSVRSGAGPLG